MLTYRQRFNKKYGFEKDASHSLKEISDLTGYKLSGLKIIEEKGAAAYFGNPSSVRANVMSAEQWKRARTYSAVMGGKAARVDAAHLVKKIKSRL